MSGGNVFNICTKLYNVVCGLLGVSVSQKKDFLGSKAAGRYYTMKRPLLDGAVGTGQVTNRQVE